MSLFFMIMSNSLIQKLPEGSIPVTVSILSTLTVRMAKARLLWAEVYSVLSGTHCTSVSDPDLTYLEF